MEDFLIKGGQLMLSLTILVTLHELGHFVPAKWFKTKVEKFYLFFDFLFPFPNIGNFSLFKLKKGDTEYGLGWFPFGGYVKIAGMVDESMDKEQMEKEPEPWEFRSKPAWQRLIIMAGGVIVNAVLAVIIYSMVMMVWGETYLPNKSLKDGVWVADSMALNMGFKSGDKVVAVNDKEIVRFSEIVPEMLYGGTVHIERQGKPMDIDLPENFIEQLIEKNKRIVMFMPRTPFVVGHVPDSSAASTAGLTAKDKIVSVANKPIRYFDEIQTVLGANKSSNVDVVVERNGESVTLDMPVSAEGKLEFMPTLFSIKDMKKAGIYEFSVKEYGLFSAVPAGFNKAVEKLGFYAKQMGLILDFTNGAYKGVGGFGSMGKMFPSTWDWQTFWEMTAFLSVILAFMNLLPIPMLDGGYILFLLVEMVIRRPVPDKVMEYANMLGFAFILLILVFSNGNDIVKAFN